MLEALKKKEAFLLTGTDICSSVYLCERGGDVGMLGVPNRSLLEQCVEEQLVPGPTLRFFKM